MLAKLNRHEFSRHSRAAENTALIRLDSLDTLKTKFWSVEIQFYAPPAPISREKAAGVRFLRAM
jgi:hypothetical protein